MLEGQDEAAHQPRVVSCNRRSSGRAGRVGAGVELDFHQEIADGDQAMRMAAQHPAARRQHDRRHRAGRAPHDQVEVEAQQGLACLDLLAGADQPLEPGPSQCYGIDAHVQKDVAPVRRAQAQGVVRAGNRKHPAGTGCVQHVAGGIDADAVAGHALRKDRVGNVLDG